MQVQEKGFSLNMWVRPGRGFGLCSSAPLWLGQDRCSPQMQKDTENFRFKFTHTT